MKRMKRKRAANKKRDGAKVSSPKGKAKVKKVMHEFEDGDLHSASKKGPLVTNPKQAVAIALSEARKSKRPKSKK